MRKYGLDNFTIFIIEECPIDLLNEREAYWIKNRNSTNHSIGYNLLEGGNLPPRTDIPVICLNNMEVYKSSYEASQIFNIQATHITDCCRFKRKTCGCDKFGFGYQWSYYIPYKKYSYIPIQIKMPVRNKITNKIYESLTKAQKDTNISIYKIKKSCESKKGDWEFYVQDNSNNG